MSALYRIPVRYLWKANKIIIMQKQPKLSKKNNIIHNKMIKRNLK